MDRHNDSSIAPKVLNYLFLNPESIAPIISPPLTKCFSYTPSRRLYCRFKKDWKEFSQELTAEEGWLNYFQTQHNHRKFSTWLTLTIYKICVTWHPSLHTCDQIGSEVQPGSRQHIWICGTSQALFLPNLRLFLWLTPCAIVVDQNNDRDCQVLP